MQRQNQEQEQGREQEEREGRGRGKEQRKGFQVHRAASSASVVWSWPVEVAPEGGEGQPACDGNSEEEGRNWKVSLSEKTRAGDSKCIIESASSMLGETSHDSATSISRAATKLRKGKRFE